MTLQIPASFGQYYNCLHSVQSYCFAMQRFRQTFLPCCHCCSCGCLRPAGEHTHTELRLTWSWQAAIRNRGEIWLGWTAGEVALPIFSGSIPFHKTTNTHSDRGVLSVVITGDNCLMIIFINSSVAFSPSNVNIISFSVPRAQLWVES